MGSRSNPKIQSSDILPNMGGPDLRIASDVWRKLGESEARLHLLVELGYIEVGFPDVEKFCLELESKYRATVTGELRDKGKKSPEWQIVKLCMGLKMIDEKKLNSKLETERYKLRKTLDELFGRNSRRTRNIIKKLRQGAAKNKAWIMKKYEEKLKNLRRKFRTSEEENINRIPEAIADLRLETLSIFSKDKFEEKLVVNCEAEVIGQLTPPPT